MKKYVWLLVVLLPSFLFGATTGKVMGWVRDSDTGNPLGFTNVFLEHSAMGSISNEDGYYFIINIPPGQYNVRAQMMGYRTVVKRGVLVEAGKTVFLNFELEETVIELKEALTVEAKRPLIEPGATHTSRVYETREMERLPTVHSVLRLLETQPEVVKDYTVEEYHLRGGRGGEILYLIDGIPVNDRFVGGSAAIDIPVFEVKQVEILKGGFETEYGEVQSGIVNLITIPPDTGFHVLSSYKTDRIRKQSNTDIFNFSISNPLPFTQNRVLLLVTGFGDYSDTYTPFGAHHNRNELWGISYGDRQRNAYGFSAKALIKVLKHGKLVLTGRTNAKAYEKYEHQFIEIPDNAFHYRGKSSLAALSWNHTIGSSAFYELKISSFNTEHSYDPGKTPPDIHLLEEEYLWAEDHQIPWIVDDRGEATDTDLDWFYEMGYDSTWHMHRERNNSLLFDVSKQFENKHFVKFGFEHHLWQLEKEEIEVLWFYDSTRISDEGPFPGYGWSRDIYSSHPQQGGVYLQDRFEREGLILNYGLRYDYFYVGPELDVEKPFQGYFSPRIGFFYPFTDKDALTFSFGLYYQMPEYQYIFMSTTWRGPYKLVGNPELRPECTRAYEFRIEHELPMRAALSLTMYRKDIKDLINAELVGRYPLESYKITNSSYGDAWGMEFEFRKPVGVHFTGRAVYIISWAKGRATKDLENFEDMELGEVTREYPLSWDERHRVKIIWSYETGSDTTGNLTGATVAFSYGSGLPYSILEEVKAGRLAKNSARLPSHANLDIEIYRKMHIANTSCELSLIVENATNAIDIIKPQEAPVPLLDPTTQSKPRTFFVEIGFDL